MEAVIPKSEVRRSFTLTVFNGVLFNSASRLIDPPLVLTWFVSQLTSSNVLIGLVSPWAEALWFLPQLFISNRIQRMERKMDWYSLTGTIRVVLWILLAVMVWFVDAPGLLLVGFFVLSGTAWLAGGLAGISFFDVVAKTIPTRRRGSLFAWRQFLGGLLGLGAAWIVGLTLDVLQGELLGQHAMALTIVAYLTLRFHLQIRIFPLWQLTATVFALLAVEAFILFWIDGVAGNPPVGFARWTQVLTGAILWPVSYTHLTLPTN